MKESAEPEQPSPADGADLAADDADPASDQRAMDQVRAMRTVYGLDQAGGPTQDLLPGI